VGVLASDDDGVVHKIEGVFFVVCCSTCSCHAVSNIIKGFSETRFSDIGDDDGPVARSPFLWLSCASFRSLPLCDRWPTFWNHGDSLRILCLPLFRQDRSDRCRFYQNDFLIKRVSQNSRAVKANFSATSADKDKRIWRTKTTGDASILSTISVLSSAIASRWK